MQPASARPKLATVARLWMEEATEFAATTSEPRRPIMAESTAMAPPHTKPWSITGKVTLQ